MATKMPVRAVGYRCPVCDEQISAAVVEMGRVCYHYRWPYPEGRCCHFGEVLIRGELERVAIETHTHEVAQ